ncbi:MAG: hypothetical protein JO340_19470, partial [Acidobacteriaceae bacterium]|nr:hypothetical protein [Acidobacteriaceae bacterium]
IPDQQGRTIPLGIHEGSAVLTGSQGESEHILVAVESGTYNVQKATCGSTYCKTCMGATESFIDSDPWGLPVASSVQETFTAQYNTGSQFNLTSAASWTSGNTSIATVSAGKVAARAAGTTFVAANDPNTPDYTSGCYAYSIECPLETGEEGQAAGDATPEITGLSPGTVGVGRTAATLNISGTGFGASPSVSVVDADGNDVPVTVQSGATNTSIAATINTTNAALGAADVTVTSNGQESNASSFSIVCVAPTSFKQTSQNCASSTGVLSFTYSWASPTGSMGDLATCTVSEVVTYPDNGQPPSPPFPNSAFINPTILSGPATSTVMSDGQYPPSGSFVKPYSQTTYTATQTYQYACGCSNNGMAPTPFPGFSGIPIQRQVANPSGTWIYQITKSGSSCSLSLPQ